MYKILITNKIYDIENNVFVCSLNTIIYHYAGRFYFNLLNKN